LELSHLFLFLIEIALLLGLQDQRGALGWEVAAADEPLVSLKDVGVSRAVLGFCLLGVVAGSGC
jgi:hypothetical protein